MFNDKIGAKALINNQVKNNRILLTGPAFSKYQKVYFSTKQHYLTTKQDT